MGGGQSIEEEDQFKKLQKKYKFIKKITDASLGSFKLLQHSETNETVGHKVL